MARSFSGSGLDFVQQVTKSYSMSTQGLGNGHFYIAGFYDAPATDATLTIGGTVTQTYGDANSSVAAHAFVVFGSSSTSGGTLTVTGTSITDGGVRTTSDSEVITANTDESSADEYYETSKKWLGTVTFTLAGASGAIDINYGFAKYEDFGNSDFVVRGFECKWLGGANDPNFNLRLLKHSDSGWSYSATAFVPGGDEIVSLQSIHSTEHEIYTGDHGACKRTGLNTEIEGTGSDGVVIDVYTSVNNSLENLNAHIGVVL